MPAQAGIQPMRATPLDSRLRGNDTHHTALPISSMTFFASPKTIIVLSM